MSQGDVARLSGMKQPVISRLLSADNEPGLDTVEKIAELFGIEASDLIKTKEPKVASFTVIQREIIRIVSSLPDDELKPVLPVIRLLETRKQKKQA